MQIQYLGRFLDLKEDEKVSYTMQVQDLADVSAVNSSVTTSFKIPKTVTNLDAFKQLSIPSDSSNLPYIKNEVRLYDQGTIFINNAWLKVNSSDEEYYNVNIEDGIIDFFKAIENKTIGADLDLSSTQHNKDLVSVIDSFERNDYTYIIADYNGLNTYFQGGNEYINIDYSVPSLNNKYIWDKIFELAQFSYSGSVFNTDEFTNLWLTYPKAPPTSSQDEQYPEPVLRFRSFSNNPNIPYDPFYEGYLYFNNLENVSTNGIRFDNGTLTAETSGTYRFRWFGSAPYAEYSAIDEYGQQVGDYAYKEYLKVGYLLNGVEIRPNRDAGLQAFTVMLRAGDTFKFFMYWDFNITGMNIPYTKYQVGDFDKVVMPTYDFQLLQTSQTIIDFGAELLDFSITDYVKELMIRFSLTPFIDNENRHIHFLTLNERLQGNKLIDWTDKYIQRTNESYTYNSYGINNWFRHKYNDENATFNDGKFSVNNVNLEPNKDLFNSKIYSYNNEITNFYQTATSTDFQNNSFPIWSREIKETINNDNGERTFEVKYKGLSNRYYFIRRKYLNKSINIGSQLLSIEQAQSNVPIADTNKLSYNEVITDRYNNFGRVLNDTRIHEIEVSLNVNDLLSLDLQALYFFSQENQYYILNRMSFDLDNRVGKGEFLRVKYR